MVKRLALLATVVMAAAVPALAQDANAVIAAAQKTLGDVQSISYSGTARDVAFQQCGANTIAMTCRGIHDPTRPIANYVRVIDLVAPASRHTGDTNNIGPGGSTTTAPGTFFQQVTAQQADVSQPWAGSVEFYLTPWGFLKGAAASNATVSTRTVDGQRYSVVSWSPAVKAASGRDYVINGFINAQNQVARVETWLADNIMGDMHIVATYTGWRDFGGAMAPARIVQTRGGWPFFEVSVTAARANMADVATLVPAPAPAAGRAGGPAAGGGRAGGAPGTPPAMTVTVEQLGEGLHRLTTGAGSYDSLVVEFRDHVMLLEAGQSEARSIAYLEEVRKLYPTKPLRYVWNSHPHADHTGGLPPFVAEGVTIVTQANNRVFLERALNAPRTLLTDRLAKTPQRVKIETVGTRRVFSDDTRTVEFLHVTPTPHTNGMLVAYLPKEKILFQADYTLPAAGQQPNDHVRALVAFLDRVNLDFERFIPVHAPATPLTRADVFAAVGR